ncbi:MAG TPA: CBS domain-containing protein [Candidatus Omnitrophota bacterium]|nr:CBS domain-containing protein [Candidatus Omnitrophota bacterium]
MIDKNIPIKAEDSASLILDLIYQLKIKDVMSRDLVVACAQDTLHHIKTLMKQRNVTGIPIVKKDRLLGILSIDDIFKALDNGYMDELAEKYMSKKLVILEEDMPLAFAISYFDKFKYGRFPVVDKDNLLVGMITSRDINVGLLMAINKEVSRMEEMLAQNAPVDAKNFRKVFRIRKYDFEHAGIASNRIKKLLTERKHDPRDIRRVAVAMYEMEINITVHSEGGTLTVAIDQDRAEIVAKDAAPGIENPELALQEGYSTANEWIKSLGFGAGMGLANIRRVSDEFEFQSSLGKGTTVRAVIYFKNKKGEEHDH